MKKTAMIIALILAIMLTGCITSLYPLYTIEDLLTNDFLTGKYGDPEEPGEYWEFSPNKHEEQTFSFGTTFNDYSEKAYRLKVVEENAEAEFVAHLVELGGNTFIDFYPVDYELQHDFLSWHLVPTHLFARIDIHEDFFVWQLFDDDWLNDLIEKNKIRISHHKLDYFILLSASTRELQKFITKYGDDPEAYMEADTIYKLPQTSALVQ